MEGGACERCPSNSSNAAGDDPSGVDTTCDFEPCQRSFGALCDSLNAVLYKAPIARENDFMGRTVLVASNLLVAPVPSDRSCDVGFNAEWDEDGCPNSGAVSMFSLGLGAPPSGLPAPTLYLKPPRARLQFDDVSAPESARFGTAVSYVGDWLAVSAPNAHSETGCGDEGTAYCTNSGAAYLYRETGGARFAAEPLELSATPRGRYEGFGTSVSLNTDRVAIGAQGERSCSGDPANNGCPSAGAVYIFDEVSSGQWVQTHYIKPIQPRRDERFGRVLSLDGDLLAVGVPQNADCGRGISVKRSSTEGCSGSGAVYLFQYNTNTKIWSQSAYIKSSNARGGHAFGTSIVLRDSTLIVSAPDEDSCGAKIEEDPSPRCDRRGAVYLFTRDDAGNWSESGALKPPAHPSGAATALRFGISLALGPQTLFVGAPGHASCASGHLDDHDTSGEGCPSRGAVYQFERDADGAWERAGLFKPTLPQADDVSSGDEFGSALSFGARALAVGAIRDDRCGPENADDTDSGRCNDSGAIYLWRAAP